MLDVRQAEQLVFTAAGTIPDLERRIEQQENFISTLLGNNPGPIVRGIKLTDQTAFAGHSRGAFLQPLGAATRHSPGRSTIDRGQRSDRSGKSSLLPTNHLDGERRISEFSAYQPVYRSGWIVELRRITGNSPSSPGEEFVPV